MSLKLCCRVPYRENNSTLTTASAYSRCAERRYPFRSPYAHQSGREVNKRKNEQYKLVWKNRLGLARLAIQHGYPIVPFASVGAEHGIDIVQDTESKLMAPMQFLAEKLPGTPDGAPLVRGVSVIGRLLRSDS